ncbi:MAG: DEAD/DEAH box helicase [Anaerolineales bacterium]
MTIFDLHAAVLNEYRDFVRSFIQIADERIRAFVNHELDNTMRLWPDFLLQVSPAYERTANVDELAQSGSLHPETARIFRSPHGAPYTLYRHQQQALEKARRGESYIVTSGTGSGKSLTYFLPIVQYLLSQVDAPKRTIALIVYPMNALVNSQLQALETLKNTYETHFGKPFPVTFAKYTGETGETARQEMRQHPPHILLTNYMMAELMLVRPEDQRFLDAAGGGLRFLVFDELHTYRGRQGADVAMLIRRLKERAAAPGLIHIGTSATMVNDSKNTPAQRRQTVADFASRFFGHYFTEADIIEETLVPFTRGTPPTAEELRAAFDASLPLGKGLGVREYQQHPLSRWIEHTFGIQPEPEGNYRRRVPISLSDAATRLAEETGIPAANCEQALRTWLTQGASLPRAEGGYAFALKLHQFIGQGRAVYASIEAHEQRDFNFEGQIQGENERIYLPIKFCRHCGQEYYHVLQHQGKFNPHPLGLFEEVEGFASGYLMLASPENDWSEDDLPEEWRESNGRIKRDDRERVPVQRWVSPAGEFFTSPRANTVKMWYQPQPFSLCLNCGEFYTRREGEFRKLVSVSSEARSSATTILASSLLRQSARTNGAIRDKLLTFTDNRQDASLQAGHFNDFIQRSILRAATVAALKQSQVLTFDQIAHQVTSVLQRVLSLREIARNADLAPEIQAAREIWKTFTDLTEYRLYEDLQRGWRVIQPNLEELGLMQIEYRGLEALCHQGDAWSGHASLAACTPTERMALLRPMLDLFRYKSAINSHILQEQPQIQLRRRSEQHLNEFWGLDLDANNLQQAREFVLRGSAPRPTNGFSLGDRSLLGRYLRNRLNLTTAEYPALITALLNVLVRHGLLERLAPIEDHQRFQLDAACLQWRLGDGTPPPPDVLYTRRATAAIYGERSRPINAFFQRFYQETAAELAGLEAREHTAQVVAPGERERRERRFRWETGDSTKESELGRRLPYLVCSPTMELGVDIADLDLVHLRNVPPTPANYAQRSGRAGRQGQAGLIFTYCGALNPHDQYFFRKRQEMVAGSVRAPKLDLASESLLSAHLHALWLAEIRLPLRQSIEEVIDTEQDTLPLRPEVQAAIHLSHAAQQRLRERMRCVLQADEALLRATRWYTDDWLKQVIERSASDFDGAFEHWREMYRAATRQLYEAQTALLRARRTEEQQNANRQQQEALRQRNLLLQIETSREESDFYPYRYLASEGFLPGYNFPALPVRAWVPRSNGEYIPRARFLALREFAPGNFVYHEGARWEVIGFQSPPGGLDERRRRQRLCYACGSYCEPSLDLCPVCNTLFNGENSLIADLLNMPNVKTRRRERITSNEEERMRRGYRIETFYQFSPTANSLTADVIPNASDDPLFHLIYAPVATLLRVNHGARAARLSGFRVDFESGDVVRENEEITPSRRPQRIETVSLSVQDTQNILLVRPANSKIFEDRTFETTLRVALQRGLEQMYQLEESELSAESIGIGEYRAILFYETSEGGSGVLRRLLEEPHALAEVARSALERAHYDEHGRDQKADCIAACYECLLSYSNQIEAMFIDRRKVQQTLLNLTQSRVLGRSSGRTYFEQSEWLRAQTDARSQLERDFLDALITEGYRLPDDCQHAVNEPRCNVDFFYEPNICVFCDGSVHDQPDQRRQDETLRTELRARGYEVVVIRYDHHLREQIAAHPQVF